MQREARDSPVTQEIRRPAAWWLAQDASLKASGRYLIWSSFCVAIASYAFQHEIIWTVIHVQGSSVTHEPGSSVHLDTVSLAAGFDLDSPYYALHCGLGYVWNITEDHDVDVYGKYIWTRVDGPDETLTTGDKFEFDDMDSSRVRFSARYTYKGNEHFMPYAGVAYEHEFAGSCDTKTYGLGVPAPSFEGDTGIGELGVTMTPSKDLPLSVNLGVQGYVGQKRGVSGNCMVKYEF